MLRLHFHEWMHLGCHFTVDMSQDVKDSTLLHVGFEVELECIAKIPTQERK